jgi:hypothetical protein
MFGDHFGGMAGSIFVTTPPVIIPAAPVTNPITPPGPVNVFNVLAAFSARGATVLSGSTIQVPSPWGGGVVGQNKVSEDNNPLPRDRFIFDYDYYNRVPLIAGGVPVNRFTPGIEWAPLGNWASFQVRTPFAATITPDIQSDGQTTRRRAEFGDVNLIAKFLLICDDSLNVATGLAIDLPTARGTTVLAPDGTTAVRVNNSSVLLTPYVGYLLTPGGPFFFQNWFEFVFDATGSRVEANTGGLNEIGRLHQQSILEIDAQLGFWAYRCDCFASYVRGLAPFVELHYNSSMGRSDLVAANGFQVGLPDTAFGELNLSAGVVAQVSNNCLLEFGAVVPLRGHTDRSFDYQLGIRGTVFFGQTAYHRNYVGATSGF